eukprot:TRINITY_DN22705_c0_g1_i1.p1 TRINITY_DN22705_c0_g1~~TRINITY_DN22705_c0_g1_i1.p1  ORF type:complete len:581 (+),score=203.05 TRINITY_DN22705_c0_g1_i1:93-1745(+)
MTGMQDGARAPLLDSRKISIKPLQPAEDTGTFGAPYLRWTIFYAFLIVVIATMPLWLAAVAPRAAGMVNTVIVGILCLAWLTIAFNAERNFRKLLKGPIPKPSALAAWRNRKFRHIVIVPCYLDPTDVLISCIESLAQQDDPQSLCVVVTLEAKTPELDEKRALVQEHFEGRFGTLLVVVHTINRSTEIAGGCSNKNFALRQAYAHVSKQSDFGEYRWTVTTCDTDSLFHSCYFTTLQACYNNENPDLAAEPKMLVWQPPLFYNWDLDKRPFFNRVTGLMRSMMMLGGLISFNLNPMSIFSYPVELGLHAGFINPRYSVDDIIAKVRWMCTTNTAVPVRILPVPVISGPTIGTTWVEEWYEWGRQIRRWIIGSSESFHYFLIHWRGRPMLSGITWMLTFCFYYGVMLCCGALFTILASQRWPWGDYKSAPLMEPFTGDRPWELTPQQVGLWALILQQCAFAVAFLIDLRAVRMLELGEYVNPLRNLAHWISAPIVLTIYSLIAFVSIVRFIWEGKKMAGHDMAAKEGLNPSPTASPTHASQEASLQGLAE